VLVSCVIGTGIGFAFGAMPALIMGAVPPSQTGAANSLNTLMRSIGTSVAGAVAGVILAQMTTNLGSVALPSERLQDRPGDRRRRGLAGLRTGRVHSASAEGRGCGGGRGCDAWCGIFG
jgi:MFS family permease